MGRKGARARQCYGGSRGVAREEVARAQRVAQVRRGRHAARSGRVQAHVTGVAQRAARARAAQTRHRAGIRGPAAAAQREWVAPRGGHSDCALAAPFPGGGGEGGDRPKCERRGAVWVGGGREKVAASSGDGEGDVKEEAEGVYQGDVAKTRAHLGTGFKCLSSKLGQNKLVVMDFNGPPERVYATLVCGQAALPWCGGPPPRPPLRAPLRSVARRTGARSRAEQEKAIFG